MQLKKFSFAETHSFSSFFLDYMQQKETLKPFYNRFPNLENFEAQLDEKQKSFNAQTRQILFNVLTQQYEAISSSRHVTENISALKNTNTFTVTTGHQLNVFTGPLYFIFKIVTVINTCKHLKKLYPNYNFVPVYWMASEDHDFEEIKYFRLYGKKYNWNTNQKGAVGRFHLNDIEDLLKQIPGDISVFREAYTGSKTLSGAVRKYVDSLFSEEGLIVVDADDAALKSILKPVIESDVIGNSVKPVVEKTNTALEELGYKTQIYCRDINFFFLDEGIRSRIEKQGEKYHVLETSLSFTLEELKDLINNNPEKFSPNVILRPLYQEMILPNVAYIGGPAEVIYWLQLKNVFENFKVSFPVIMPRNFGMVINHEVNRKLEKTGLELKDIFEEKNFLFNHWILKHSPRNLTVGVERSQILELFEKLKVRAELVDKTLSPFVGAEGKRALNSLEKIERKLLRAEKRLHADKLRQIEFVKDSLFPNGTLQERTDNFLNFYQQNNNFINELLNHLAPFDFRFNILVDD